MVRRGEGGDGDGDPRGGRDRDKPRLWTRADGDRVEDLQKQVRTSVAEVVI